MKFRLAIVALVAWSGGVALAQSGPRPVADYPDPFQAPIYQWAKTPSGRPWGEPAGIEIGPHNEVWAINRCGASSCEGSDIAPVCLLDMATGKAIKCIGAGLFVVPHGLTIDRSGNVWVTDAQASKDGKKGQQVIELSPDGRVLMRLGTAGVAGGGPDHFNNPGDVALAPDGDIFVADGHGGGLTPDTPPDYVTRIVKFSKDGKFLRQWGKVGSGPSEFRNPHAVAFDARGRLFVADRGNARIQIFDQNGKLLAQWKQFGAPSGLYIDKSDTLYAIDANTEGRRGIWIGSAKTGKVTSFVPDDHSGEGVLAGPAGNLYGAVNLPPNGITKYPKR